jgi:hypothetical protein
MEKYFNASIDNVVGHGDTDIFPLPIENIIIRDQRDSIIDLLNQIDSNFVNQLTENPPHHIECLAPVGLTGFRWASQLDPIWNLYFLAEILSAAEKIEAARLHIDSETVFSYRLRADITGGSIFRDDINWRGFVLTSIERAKVAKFVMICDIADCYQRIPHHRLENALEQILGKDRVTERVMRILADYSRARSYGVPIGGPAARVLVESLLDMSDKIFRSNQIEFVRYVDDYHVFCDSIDDAYRKLRLMSEKLARNEGLAFQKAKTRIMTSSEFIASQALVLTPDSGDASSDLRHLFSLKLRYDPYSDNAEAEYAELKKEITQLDIIGMLNRELAKTRVHSAVTKKLVASIQHLDIEEREQAVRALLGNIDALYPIFPVVAMTIKKCYGELDPALQEEICDVIRCRLLSNHFLLGSDIHVAYAIRLLSELKSAASVDAVAGLYPRYASPVVRRDVILVMAQWREFAWLSDIMNDFQSMGPWERRAFIIATHTMGDAGYHWRRTKKRSLKGFDAIVDAWAEARFKDPSWRLPL